MGDTSKTGCENYTSYFILLWIKKSRGKDKTYIWGSVRWKTQKLKMRNLHTSHTLGWAIPDVIHTSRRQFRRGRYRLSGSVERTDTPVTYVSEEGGDGEVPDSETPSLMSYTLRYVSFGEVDNIYRVPLWLPIHPCTCVSEEGDDGEAPYS
jgi:hypothetical protein